MSELEMKSAKRVDKEKVARSFLRGQHTYDAHAIIQYKVSRNLVDKLSHHSQISYANVLEIGCCTGNLTELLLQNFPIENLYLNDLVPHFQEIVCERVSGMDKGAIIPMFGDIEKIELPENLDLVVSSATFQWLADIKELFGKISHSLQPEGYLVFSIFGPGTLAEFREITGIGLEYSPIGELLDMLENDFHIEEEETSKEVLFFSSPKEVLRHLQATGVGGVQEYKWTPNKLRNFEEAYADRFGGTSGVPVTYMSSYILASKKG